MNQIEALEKADLETRKAAYDVAIRTVAYLEKRSSKNDVKLAVKAFQDRLAEFDALHKAWKNR